MVASQLEYNLNRGRGRAGLLINDYPARIRTGVNAAAQAAQVTQVVPTADNDAVYTLTVQGISVSYTADGSAAKDEISGGLKSAIETSSPLIYSLVIPTVDGSDNLILTARSPGLAITVTGSATGSGALAITTTTSAASASRLPFGAGVLRDVNYSRGVVLPASSLLTAQAVVLTPAEVNSTLYTVTVTYDGVDYVASYTSDSDATPAEICTGIAAVLNGLLPASSVIAAEDTGTLTLTAEVAGVPFGYGFGSDDATATWAITSDNSSSVTDINRLFAGLAALEDSHEAATVGSDDASYEPNSDVSVLMSGLAIVEASGVSVGDDVYLGTSGTEAGKFFNASGSGRYKLSVAEWYEPSIGDKAVLRMLL